MCFPRREGERDNAGDPYVLGCLFVQSLLKQERAPTSDRISVINL